MTAEMGKCPCTVEHIRRLSLNSSKMYTGARRDDTREVIRVARYGIQRAMFHGMKNRSSACAAAAQLIIVKQFNFVVDVSMTAHAPILSLYMRFYVHRCRA
jgi:hypothetical protein